MLESNFEWSTSRYVHISLSSSPRVGCMSLYDANVDCNHWEQAPSSSTVFSLFRKQLHLKLLNPGPLQHLRNSNPLSVKHSIWTLNRSPHQGRFQSCMSSTREGSWKPGEECFRFLGQVPLLSTQPRYVLLCARKLRTTSNADSLTFHSEFCSLVMVSIPALRLLASSSTSSTSKSKKKA